MDTRSLFSNGFMMRQHCGAWEPIYVAIYEWSNQVIALSYLAIAVILAFALFVERTAPDKTGPLLAKDKAVIGSVFALFFFACGTMHYIDGVLSFTRPPQYHMVAVGYALQAVVSAAGAVVTFRYRARVLRFL